MPDRKNKKKSDLIGFLILIFFIAFSVNPALGIALFLIMAVVFIKKPEYFKILLAGTLPAMFKPLSGPAAAEPEEADGPNLLVQDLLGASKSAAGLPAVIGAAVFKKKRLEKRKKYLQVALNSTLEEAREILAQIPSSDRLLIEAGTPLIKIYGTDAISRVKAMAPAGAYIVADNKCADLAGREVEMMALAGANAATCLGVAPIETIDGFIEACQKFNIDSMIDMMNVESALAVLKKLKKLPDVVMLHRGVDESEFSKEKQIPLYQIKQIKGSYNILVAVAGGDTIKEVQRAIFNDADIVVVWKNFYQASEETAQLAESFLKEIK